MAYAAVVSLHQILEQQINLQSDQFPKPEIEHLRIKVLSLIDSLEKIYPVSNSNKNIVKDLETRIRDAIYAAQDTIESYISGHDTKSIFEQQLQVVIESIDPLTEEAEQIKNKLKTILPADDSVSSSKPKVGSKNKIVGLEDDVEKLIGKLTGAPSMKLEIVPIVGMAGIGKTTLATAIYNDPRTEKHFDTRAWVTVSQEYRARDIFSGLLSSMKLDEKSGQEIDQDHLATKIHQNLMHTRYFIVIDDMWDTKIWDNMRRFFPENENGSRIVLTTRLLGIAQYVNPYKLLHKMQFLNEENSWKLLCQNAFADAWCPLEFEKVGKKIVKKCEGLPLGIISIANMLSKAENSLESWEKVAKNENLLALATEQGSPMSEVLFLSYTNLPPQLKECCLFFGAFPINHEISVSKLVKLWVGEGLIKPDHLRTFEDIARMYLEGLVSHSIVLVRQQSSSGETKTCSAHYFFWHLYVGEAANKKIFHLINSYPAAFLDDIQCQHRLCIHRNALLGFKHVSESIKSVSKLRSFLCTGPEHQYPVSICPGSTFMRVLDALTIRLYEFPIKILELVLLKYLAFTYDGKLPSSILRLKNLVYLIVHRYHLTIINSSPSYMPIEIWNMQELRHLQVMGSDLPYPDDGAQLPNLLTLLGVSDRSCTKEVLQSIPNLEKLGVHIVLPHGVSETLHIFDHLALLSRLKSFKCIVLNPNPRSQHVLLLPESNFPSNLTKLTLSGCGFAWEDMSMIGHALTNLRVLKLRCYAFQGPEWVVDDEEEFPKLEYMLLEDTDLVHWKVGESCFRELKHLIIRHCYKLRKIIVDDDVFCFFQLESLIIHHCFELVKNLEWVVYLMSLVKIEFVDCSPDSIASAKKIQQLLEEFGMVELKVGVFFMGMNEYIASLNGKEHIVKE